MHKMQVSVQQQQLSGCAADTVTIALLQSAVVAWCGNMWCLLTGSTLSWEFASSWRACMYLVDCFALSLALHSTPR
jgi:hypothetical protein